MRLHFNPLYMQWALRLLILVLSVQLFYTIVGFFLDDSDVEFHDTRSYHTKSRYHVDALFVPQHNTQAAQTSGTPSVAIKGTLPALQGWKLHAIFSDDVSGGIIVVEVNTVSHFLNLGESLQGYKVIKILPQKAILQKSGQNFALSLAVEEDANSALVTTPPAQTSYNVKELEQGIVKRSYINEHITDPSKIWNNIKIAPVRKGREITGFLVRYVKKGSVFEHLGLQVGDRIKSVNGIPLRSIQDARNIYAGIDSFESLTVGIRRKKTDKELFYEIK